MNDSVMVLDGEAVAKLNGSPARVTACDGKHVAVWSGNGQRVLIPQQQVPVTLRQLNSLVQVEGNVLVEYIPPPPPPKLTKAQRRAAHTAPAK